MGTVSMIQNGIDLQYSPSLSRQWVQEALDIYIKAHTALANEEVEQLHTLVTEKCFPELMYMAQRKTIRWAFIKSLEPPRVVHARYRYHFVIGTFCVADPD